MKINKEPYLSRDCATSRIPNAERAFLSHTTLVSEELIVNALANILAPMSPIRLPLMSKYLRVLLPHRAFIIMVVSLRSLESAILRDSKAYKNIRLCGTGKFKGYSTFTSNLNVRQFHNLICECKTTPQFNIYISVTNSNLICGCLTTPQFNIQVQDNSTI